MQFLFHAIAGVCYTHDEFGPFPSGSPCLDFNANGEPIAKGRAQYSGYDAIDDGWVNQKGGYCDNGENHGTHVAALAGGLTYGVAKGATLYSVCVVDCNINGAGTDTDIINGLDHAVNKIRSTPNQRCGIINMSLGGLSGIKIF